MGLFSWVGDALNDLTGASSAQKKAQKYNKQNMAKSQDYTLEQMAKNQKYTLQQMAKNFQYEKVAANSAHQWAMADLEKAGLNPILAATDGANLSGSVAGGSVSGGASAPSAPAPQSGIDIITALSSAKQMLANANLAEKQGQLTESQQAVNSADVNLKQQLKEESKAKEKYTNERARGFSESVSESHEISKNSGWSIGGNGGYKIENEKLGSTGINGGGNISRNKGRKESHSYSHSRTH
jgi:hypothetical protein